MKTVNLSKHTYVTKNGEDYFYTDHNQYTNSYTTSAMQWDEKGECETQGKKFKKANIDVSFHVQQKVTDEA